LVYNKGLPKNFILKQKRAVCLLPTVDLFSRPEKKIVTYAVTPKDTRVYLSIHNPKTQFVNRASNYQAMIRKMLYA
jgi:hypothetical protein